MSAVVVGGGLAGLLAARRIRGSGTQVTVLEAAARPGGMISAIRVGALVVDGGAEAIATRSAAAVKLCEDLGLRLVPPHGRPHVWWPERISPLADGVLGIPASPHDAALEALEPAVRAEVLGDLMLPADVGATANTVGDLVAARMGHEAVRQLVAPLTRGVFRTDPYQLKLAAVAPRLLTALAEHGTLMAAVASIHSPGGAVVAPQGGLYSLIDALAKGLDVRTDVSATAVHRTETGWQITTPIGSFEAQRLVLATPAAVTAQLLAPVGLDLPDLPTTASYVALLTSTHPGLAPGPVGSGLLLGEPNPEVAATALTHYSHKWPWVRGHHVIRMTYPDAPDENQIIHDASVLTKLDLAGTITATAVASWNLPGRIEPAQAAQIRAAAAAVGVELVGCWINGNGIAPIVEAVEHLT